MNKVQFFEYLEKFVKDTDFQSSYKTIRKGAIIGVLTGVLENVYQMSKEEGDKMSKIIDDYVNAAEKQ